VGAVLPEAILADLVAARMNRVPMAYVVDPVTQSRKLLGVEAYPVRFKADKSGFEGDVFVGIHNPPLKLIIVGAVHIAQPLLVMARLAGYDPVLVDPRTAFGSQARFPDQVIIEDWPDQALKSIGLDSRCAVVTLSHDPKIDDPALIMALGSEAFYIGSLGSTRTHAKRVIRLTKAGFSPAQIGRIHAPVGLNIGGKSPAEIAISILAQLTECLYQS
ncbi:XdhC/CoxI family protein, partial [Marinosulfonomonas sp. PRT-SC04]